MLANEKLGNNQTMQTEDRELSRPSSQTQDLAGAHLWLATGLPPLGRGVGRGSCLAFFTATCEDSD